MPIVFIHAPAWSATRHERRTRVCEYVSIHAPAGGATAMVLYVCLIAICIRQFANRFFLWKVNAQDNNFML